jgi:hypothetical protein
MAYAITAAIAVDDATPHVNQNVTATLTLTNSGTIDVVVDGVEIIPVQNSALLLGSTSPDDLPQAGVNQATTYGQKTVASGGGTGTFLFKVRTPSVAIGSIFYLNARAVGTRSDTGVRVQVDTTSAASLTID